MTPSRYRAIGTGVDTSEISDAQLQAYLNSASIAVNAAVHAPSGYSFHGGTVTDEEHQWDTGNNYRRPSGRVWPYMRPLISVDSIRINPTKQQYVTFDATQVFVQTALGYAEPVAAPITTALFTSIPPWLLTSPVAYITYNYGFHEVVEDEQMASISGGDLLANNQFWFTDEEVELKKNGVVVDPADYEIDYVEGVITPDVAPADEVYQVSYHHHLPPGIALATATIATDMLGARAIAGAGMLGLSAIKVEEVELRQSSKINFAVTPVSQAAQLYLGPYAAMFTSMR